MHAAREAPRSNANSEYIRNHAEGDSSEKARMKTPDYARAANKTRGNDPHCEAQSRRSAAEKEIRGAEQSIRKEDGWAGGQTRVLCGRTVPGLATKGLHVRAGDEPRHLALGERCPPCCWMRRAEGATKPCSRKESGPGAFKIQVPVAARSAAQQTGRTELHAPPQQPAHQRRLPCQSINVAGTCGGCTGASYGQEGLATVQGVQQR